MTLWWSQAPHNSTAPVKAPLNCKKRKKKKRGEKKWPLRCCWEWWCKFVGVGCFECRDRSGCSPLFRAQGWQTTHSPGKGQQHWVIQLPSTGRAGNGSLSHLCLWFHIPCDTSSLSCLCQNSPCLFHFYSYSNCFKAFTSSAPFFSDFSGSPDIFPAEPWAAQREPLKVIAHCGSAEWQNIPLHSLISFLLLFNYPFTFLTAAVGLADTFLSTKMVSFSGNSSGPTTVHVELRALNWVCSSALDNTAIHYFIPKLSSTVRSVCNSLQLVFILITPSHWMFWARFVTSNNFSGHFWVHGAATLPPHVPEWPWWWHCPVVQLTGLPALSFLSLNWLLVHKTTFILKKT